jgi:hypothetical protein
MNYIISSYFVSAIDMQRDAFAIVDEPSNINPWYESLVRNNCKGIIVHDGLSEVFMSFYPEVIFIQIPIIPTKYTLYDYRWVVYGRLMENLKAENIFFTDLFDVEIINNPFIQKEYHNSNLYCGSERQYLSRNTWIQKALLIDELQRLPGFEKIFASNNILYNCGLVGGGFQIVQKFVNELVTLINKLEQRKLDTTVDMALCNYILHRKYQPITGWPIHSVFKMFENRKDIWFKHK